MPSDDALAFPYRSSLDVPVVGLEAEFSVLLDGREIEPEAHWRHPAEFVRQPLLKRTTKSSQLPSGGAIYFDHGVIELVTPVIEIDRGCAARVVRSLWEQVGFVREQLNGWEVDRAEEIRLRGFSAHYNVSFETGRAERGRGRTIQKLALLLAHILPVPVMFLAANRRSSGVGVRPRRTRIEITLDFTPDPGLMSATAAVIIGIVREVMEWPSFLLDQLNDLPLGLPDGVTPGRHTSRKGWLTRVDQFSPNPLTTDVDAEIWPWKGELTSLRQMAHRTAWFFRHSIRRYVDPFTYRLLFAVLHGRVPSLLELPDRPLAYDDVGRGCRWGSSIPELSNYASMARSTEPATARRGADIRGGLVPPWRGDRIDRRLGTDASPSEAERRQKQRRRREPADSALPRSAYEQIFLKLASGEKLRLGDETLTPVAMKGWYHAIFRRDSDGQEEMLSIDQLLHL